MHASWLNPVEICFSVVQRTVLTPNDFADHAEVESRLAALRASRREDGGDAAQEERLREHRARTARLRKVLAERIPRAARPGRPTSTPGVKGWLVDDLPTKLAVADRSSVLLALPDPQQQIGFPTSLLIDHRGFAALQADAFEYRWTSVRAILRTISGE